MGIICIQKRFWTEMICQLSQLRILYFPVGWEKGSLCFNDLNTSKLNLVQKMLINLNNWYLATYIMFQVSATCIFNYNKNLKLFYSKSLFYTWILDFVIFFFNWPTLNFRLTQTIIDLFSFWYKFEQLQMLIKKNRSNLCRCLVFSIT